MRNYFKFAFFAFAMTLVACSTDDGITDGGNNGNGALPVKKAQTFTASLENNSTRTSSTLTGDTWSTIWKAKDAIKVAGSSATKAFKIANESDIVNGTTATFTNTTDEVLESLDGFYAVYPDVDGLTLSGSTVTGKIPSMQPLETATGINPNYQIMTGYASENAFAFKNLVSFFKVTITNNEIFKTVKIVSNNNVKIAGDFTATIASNGVPTVSVTENANARTFVEVRSTEALKEGTYYLAVLPTAGSVDVTLMLEGDYDENNGQQIYQRVKANMAFARNNVYDFGTYDCSNTTLKKKTLSRVVDLGLPSGTLWCLDDVSNSNDVSATKGYYAWGEVQSKAANLYNWNYTSSWGRTTTNYKHGVGVDRIPVVEALNTTVSDNFIRVSNILIGGNIVNGAAGTLKKYNSQSGYTHTIFDWFGDGVQDKKIELVVEDDAAYQSNNLLITPLMDQAKELVTYTTASGYSRISKVAGYTTRSVTFAATGFMRDGTSTFANKDNTKNYNGTAPYKYSNDANTGYYWTKTRAHSSDGQGEYVIINGERKRSDFMAKSLEITNGDAFVKRADRCEGRKVRPVVGNTNIKAVAAEDHFDEEETNN